MVKTTQICHLTVLEVKSSKRAPWGEKQNISTAVFFYRLQRRICFLPFAASKQCPHSLASGYITLTSMSVITSLSLTMNLLLPSIEDSWLHWTHLDKLDCFSISLSLIYACKVPFANWDNIFTGLWIKVQAPTTNSKNKPIKEKEENASRYKFGDGKIL